MDEPMAVDIASAREFLKEATRKASLADLQEAGRRLDHKHRLFQELLVPGANEAELQRVFDCMFTLRRKGRRLLGQGDLAQEISLLLHGEAPLDERFDRFVVAAEPVGPYRAIALASELLHFHQPHRYWLWTRWIWDAEKGKGALPLVTDRAQLTGDSPGQTYLKVGRATGMVAAQAIAIGTTQLGRGLFGTDVLLAAVYAVYMRTLYRLQISEGFEKFLPPLDEQVRRMLGVQRLQPGDA